MAREDAIEALQQSCISTQILAPAKSSNSPSLNRCSTPTAAVSHNNSGHIVGGAEESSNFGLASSNLNAIPTSIHGFRPVAILGRGNKGTVVLVIAKQTGAPFALKIISCRESLDSNHTATAVMDQLDTSWPVKTNKKQELGLLLSQVDETAEPKTVTDHHGGHPLIGPSRGDTNEKEILSSLSPHPFLQTLHGHFKSGEHSLLLLDFCSGGDLHTLQHKQPEKRFSETAARFYAAEVLVALEQLHNTGIVYRDLKPENILIQENGHIKLTDFDLSLKLVQSRATGRASRPNKESSSGSTARSDHESYNRQSIDNHLDDSGCRRVENAVIGGDLAVLEGIMPKQAGILKDMTRFTRLGGCFLVDGSRAREGREEHEDEDGEEADENKTADDQPIDAGQYGESKVMETGRVRRIKRVQRKKEESKIWAAMTSPEKKNKKKAIQQTKSVCFVGTDEYVAPEVLHGGEHSTAMDWWSYGVLLYEMIYGNTPFKGKNSYETLRNIMEKEAECPGMVTSAKNLISQLLVKEASKRPKVEDIKRHGFFRGLQWELLTEVARPPFIPPPYSMSEFEEKARRHQPFIRFNPNISMSRSSSSSNSSSNHQNSLASWIDEVILIHQGGLTCNSSSSAAASLNSSTSTHTHFSASSALSSSSSGGAENRMNGLHHESTEYMLNSENQNQWNSDIQRSIRKSEV